MKQPVRRIASFVGGFFVLGMMSPVSLGALTPSAQAAAIPGGNITVNAFRDYNANGTKDATGTGEPGLGAVKITASCVTDSGPDAVVGTPDDTRGTATGVTSATGALTLAVPGSPCRLEATPDATMPAALAAVFKPGAAGATNVQFVNAGGTATFSMNIPNDYCQSVAKLAMNCFTFADNANASRSANANLHVFNEDATAIDITADGRANAGQIGSTWGLAYQRSSKTILSAAYLKAHTSYGSGGAYAIYKASSTTTGSGSLFVNLDTLGVGGTADTASRTAQTADLDWAKDYTSLQRIGKFGLGGLTVGEDDRTLWVVNMTTRSLVKMDIGNGATATAPTAGTAIAIPTTQCNAATQGEARPFAVTAKNGSIWVGGVCQGIAAATYAAATKPVGWVLRYDLVANAFDSTPAITIPLDFDRGSTVFNTSVGNQATYTAWKDDYSTYQLGSSLGPSITAEDYTQPMLTGIAFINGDMVVAFRNRDVFGSYSLNNAANAAQTHYLWPAGEVLRACSTNGTSWILESNGVGTCPGSFTRPAPTGATTHLGPGGSEFYLGDGLDGVHNETIAGGIIQVPGHANLQTSMSDPTAACSAGFASLKNSDGSRASSAQLYADGCSTNITSRFGKANGIGDLEALCDEAPLEIGNRIWRDLDGNGVQDPGEPPIGGVTVNLYKAGAVVGTATTAADGTYLFGGLTNINMTGGLPIMKNMAYSLRLDNAANFTGAGPLAGTALTQPNAQTNAVDSIDSDATKVANPGGSPAGSWPTIDYTTGGAGANNHTLDYGFINTYSVGNRVWIDTDNSGTINGTEAGVDGVEVKLYAFDATCGTGTALATQTTTAGGYYRFDDLPAGKYKVVVTAINFTTGKPLAGYTGSTGAGQEANPDLDGDNNDNGLEAAPGADVCSGMITLGLDGKPEPVAETDVQAGKPETTADTRSNLTVDFGFTPAYSLGNRVFIDSDNSGTQNGTEAGIDGVEVKLYPFDAAAACGTGAAIATTTTSGGGYYRFDGLPPGKYRVVVTAVNFTAGKPLAGYTGSTGTGQEANPDLDVDNNDNGIDGAANTDVCSGMVTLGGTPAEPTGETDVQSGRPEVVPDNRSNLTVDFGFRPPTVVVPPVNPPVATTPPTTVAPTTAPPTTTGPATTAPPTTAPASSTTTVAKKCNPLSGVIYVDVNKNGTQDPNEPGIPNATVTITSASGVVTTVTTDVNGAYSSPCLDGPYTVTVSGGGIVPGSKPTDGPLPRSVTVTKPTSDVNIGFAKSDVKGIQIEATPDIAFTGTPIPTFRLIGMAFGMILVGSAFHGGSRRPKRRVTR